MATVFTRNPTHDSFAVVRTSSAQDPTLSLGLRGINTQLGVHKQGSRGGESAPTAFRWAHASRDGA